MTIQTAKFANNQKSCVVAQTIEAGAVAIQLPPFPDVSGGWRTVYEEWIAAGNTPDPYTEPSN